MSSPPNSSPICASFSVAPVSRLSGTFWERSFPAQSLYIALGAFARILVRWRISANAITCASLLFAMVAGTMIVLRQPGWAALLVLLSGCLDLLDGAVARLAGTCSKWGALLDSTLDRIADAAPLAGLVYFYADRALAVTFPLVAMVAAFVISYVRARAESLGQTLPQSFMRRAERVLLLTLSLGLGMLPLSGPIPAPMMLTGVGILAVLNVTGAFRIAIAAHRALTH